MHRLLVHTAAAIMFFPLSCARERTTRCTGRADAQRLGPDESVSARQSVRGSTIEPHIEDHRCKSIWGPEAQAQWPVGDSENRTERACVAGGPCRSTDVAGYLSCMRGCASVMADGLDSTSSQREGACRSWIWVRVLLPACMGCTSICFVRLVAETEMRAPTCDSILSRSCVRTRRHYLHRSRTWWIRLFTVRPALLRSICAPRGHGKFLRAAS